MIKLENVVGGLPLRTWAFIIAIAIFFLYLGGVTKPVLNYNNSTKTMMYPEQCFMPPTEINEEYTLLCSIPQKNVNKNHLVMGFFLLAGLIATVITDKSKIPEMADIYEAKEIITKYLDSHKEIRLNTGEIIDIGKYSISPRFLLPEERVIKDKTPERVPERYVLDILITDSEGNEHYVRSYIHPFKRYIKGFVGANRPLEDSDRCSNCGKEFDVEFIDAEDYKKFKRIKQDEAT